MTSLVAVVTGGNKGIGLGITKLLNKKNYKVITCGKSQFDDQDLIDSVDFIQGDASQYETHEILAKKAINSYGRLDLYVNNVGISEWKKIKDIDSNFLDKIFKTNVYSVSGDAKLQLNI